MVYVSHENSRTYLKRPQLCLVELVVPDQLTSAEQNTSLALLWTQQPLNLAFSFYQAQQPRLLLRSILLELAPPMRHKEH
ncbi:hypothetical protein GCM10011297_06300 [Bacterioplanes sanyensis]|nr:hypothetical protein GCM10011297_06300 [Bacterioplanes sanyensis]